MSLDISLSMSIDTGGDDLHAVTLFEANITHNVAKMASEAGCYEAIWRKQGVVLAEDLIEPTRNAITKMRRDPVTFQLLDADNGWGTYDQFLPWLVRLLDACERHPKSAVDVDC